LPSTSRTIPSYDSAPEISRTPGARVIPIPETDFDLPTRSFSPVTSTSTTSRLVTAAISDPGNSLREALNIGNSAGNYLRGTVTISDAVSSSDVNDFFRFSVDTHPNVRLNLTGLSADADVRIIRDNNSNGIVDVGEVIYTSQKSGSTSESIELLGLAGQYYVQVYSYGGSNNTNYNLSVTASEGARDSSLPSPSTSFGVAPEPNNMLGQAYGIGTLVGNRNFRGSVSTTADQNDVYRFRLGATSNLQLVMSGLTQNADVQVIHDRNNNGIVDAGEILGQSAQGGSTRETINLQNLAAGENYYVRVYAHSGGGVNNSTNYNLFLVGRPV
jgi:hypothetical protein